VSAPLANEARPTRRAVLRWLARTPLVAGAAWLTGAARAQGAGADASVAPPRPVRRGEDRCPACGMAVIDARFAAQARDPGGRTHVYDAIECLIDHRNGHNGPVPGDGPAWVADRVASTATEATWLTVDAAVLLHHPRLRTPMGGGLAAFVDVPAALDFATAQGLDGATTYAWAEVMALGVPRPWVPVR
jgi:copper chaperone NosL